MADSIYRVVPRPDGSFTVEIARSGALPQTAAGFATETEAARWIARDKRLCESDSRFDTSSARPGDGTDSEGVFIFPRPM